jgi:hypothetical protein
MRRYGYTFVKGSGADYKFSNIIEAIFFGGIIALPLLVAFNPDYAKDIFGTFILILFVFGVLAILGEILPKTTLYLSLLLVIGIYSSVVYETISHKVGSILFYNLVVQTLYFLLIAFVNVCLIRNTKKIQ